jgi:hypothetical protein
MSNSALKHSKAFSVFHSAPSIPGIAKSQVIV